MRVVPRRQLKDREPLYRRLRFLLPAAALLLAALAAVTWIDNAVNRGVTYTPAPPPIAWADVPRLGVNAFNIQFEPDRAKVTRTLELARDLGAHFVRVQMPWEDIEIAGKRDFEDRRNPRDVHSAWDKYDFIVGEASRLGLDLIARLDRPPGWARARAAATPAFQAGLAANRDSTGPPDDDADYADFVATVVARYRGRVRFFQLWNEPNLTYEWNWRTPSPEEFVALLRAGYTAAKAANPDAIILFPSLSPTDGRDARAPMTELEYLDRVYAAGGGRYFDIMSAQAYGLGQPPGEHRYVKLNWRPRRPLEHLDRPLDTRTDVSRVVLLREVMERYGDRGKAIWISEFGYNSAPVSVPEPARSTWGTPVSEEQKGDYIVGQLDRARREWPWVGVMNVWFLRWGGAPPDPRDPTAYFAIVAPDFTPLPAYTKIQAYVAEGPVAGVGVHAWGHPAVARRGDGWTVRFAGDSFALVGGAGAAQVAIDDGKPIDVALGGPDGIVAVAADLPNAAHTALILGAAAPPQAFLVAHARPEPWLWTLAPALLLLGLAVVGALTMRALLERVAP